MISNVLSRELEKEEEVVGELSRLGIRYLSRLANSAIDKDYSPAKLIADIVRQPSARVRNALITLFLAKPEYSAFVQDALKYVNDKEKVRVKFFYTAAIFLQQKNQPNSTTILPDFFSEEIGVEGASLDGKLQSLGRKHQLASGKLINWQGTYENAAKHLFHQWELEKQWNK